jgi:2-polyprenyl-6-hydroxyphenyl methylase/3-demethylubiquinone-9 3-methyltransferase
LAHAGYDEIEHHLPREGRFLDVGCGYGLFANYLALCSPGREVTGVELNERKLRHCAKGLPGVRFERRDLLAAEWRERYDGIVVLHVLHHLRSYSEQEELLAHCARGLTEQGILAILEVDKQPAWKLGVAWLVDHLLYPGDGIFYRGRPEMLALLNRLGFKAEIVSLHAGHPFPHVLYLCRQA